MSDWMNALFPMSSQGKWMGIRTDEKGQITEWQSKSLDQKARVVCEECNGTWMSDIESQHAKPVMTPLIQGELHIPLSQPNARSIALFAFKTAVILDHCQRSREPFFSRRLRHAFRRDLDIPANVSMWMCLYAPEGRRADFEVGYYEGKFSPTNPFQLYVCTYGIGYLAFQVVATKQFTSRLFSPIDTTFNNLSLPFWPQIPPEFAWPLPRALGSVQEFTSYHRRWDKIYQVN